MDVNQKIGMSDLSLILGLTQPRINDMVHEGILHPEGKPRKYVLKQAVQDYIAFLRDSLTKDSNKSEDEKRKLKAEADYREAKAAQEKLRLKELDGQMHRSEDIEAATNQLVYAVRSMLLALPGRLAVDIAAVDTAPEASKLIKDEVTAMLEDLTHFEYDPAVYAEMVKEREKWMSEGGDEPST